MYILNKSLRANMLFLTVFLAGPYALAQNQPNYEQIQIETHQVTDGIYMLTGSGGNIGVSIGEDGVFIIDDQFAPLTEKILAAIAKISDKPVRFVINTHWHADHTGGNENMGKRGALIVAHDNVHKRMSTENVSRLNGSTTPPSPEIALPVITYSETMTLHFNGNEVSIIHQAHGHTDGDSIIYFKEANVIHGGDLFFNGTYPFVDTGSNGSINGIIEAASKMLALANDETGIIPGHGPLAGKQDLQAYHDMLVMYRDNVKKLVDAGKSLEDIKKAKPNADLDEKYGKGFINADTFLELVHESL